MTDKVTYVYSKVLTFEGVLAAARNRLERLGPYNFDDNFDVVLRVLIGMTAPVGVFPPAPLTKAKTKPNLGDSLVYGTVGGKELYFNPYFFSDTGEVKHTKGSDDPNFTVEQYTQAIKNLGCKEALPNRWYIAVPPEIGRIVEEGYERGYRPLFTNKALYLFDFLPGAKPLVQTGTLPVLVVIHSGDPAHPLSGDFLYWDAQMRKSDVPEKTKAAYRKIRDNYAVVSPDGVTYPKGVLNLNEAQAAGKAERAEQAARAKGRKAILSGGQVGADAEAIGLTEQGYQNLLTLGYPYMISKYDYGNKAQPYDPAKPPPEYAQAVTGALAFLARQDPTIILGRGSVSDYARSVVDTFLRASHLVHDREADRKAKVEKMIKEDADAKRKLALWEQNGWTQRGLKQEDRFYPYEASNIYFDQTYSMVVPVAAVINHLHLGHDEAQKYGQKVIDAREAAMKDLRAKYDNMPEKVEERERQEREKREKKERNERRPQAKREIGERMRAWLEKQPVLDIGKALKGKEEYVFYLDGGLYRKEKDARAKKGEWPITRRHWGNRVGLSKEHTQATAVTPAAFVEAYGRLTGDIAEAMPVPPTGRAAFIEAQNWAAGYDRDNGLGPVEEFVVEIQGAQA